MIFKMAIVAGLLGLGLAAIDTTAAPIKDIVTYGSNDWPSNVVIKRIDLESGTIALTNELSFPGEIITKTPIELNNRRGMKLVICSDGEPGKNCVVSHPKTYYALLDESLNIVRSDSISNLAIYDVIMDRNDSLVFLYSGIVEDTGLTITKGLFRVNAARSLTKIADIPPNFQPNNNQRIAHYEYPKPVGDTDGRLFWAAGEYGKLHLLRTQSQRYAVEQDLLAGDFIAYSQIFGVDDSSQLIYVFSLSYDMPRGGGPVSNRNDASSFSKRYFASNLEMVDSIPIPNIAADSDYTRNEIGPMEKIGKYFVYYFFKSDDARYFSPAMLFIFDTRTNEARWLRVGWR